MTHLPLPEITADYGSDDYWEQHKKYRKAMNTCAECGSTTVHVENFDPIWRDGDVVCENGHHVRLYDSS